MTSNTIVYINVKSCFLLVFAARKNSWIHWEENNLRTKNKQSRRSSYDKKNFNVSTNCFNYVCKIVRKLHGFFYVVVWHFNGCPIIVVDSATVAWEGWEAIELQLGCVLVEFFRVSAHDISKKGLICIFSLNNCAVLHGQHKAIKYR